MKLFFGEIFPTVKIDEDEQQHIVKVLRMRANEEITLTDGKGNAATGNLIFEGKKITLGVTELLKAIPPFTPRLHIAIAPTKNMDRTEFFVEKATELGVSEITFLLTEKSERRNLNFERIQKQAVAASKQSLRFHFPQINDLVKLPNFIKTINPANTFIAHCEEAFDRVNLKEIPLSENTTFLIGPEGDFSLNEIKMLAEAGVHAVSLGSQRLRTETAGIFIAAWNYGKMI